MRDISRKVMRRQKNAQWVTAAGTYTDRGALVPLTESKSALHRRMEEKIQECRKTVFVFWGSSSLPLTEETELLYAGKRYRKLTSLPVESGNYQIAVRTVVERCVP